MGSGLSFPGQRLPLLSREAPAVCGWQQADRAEEGEAQGPPCPAPCCPASGSPAGTPLLKVLPPFAGNYSLSFLYTGLSKPRQGSPRFQAVAYLNDQPFFHYNSEGRRAEPLAPWSQVEGMEDWEKESALQRAREDIFMETLSDIMDYYKDSEGEWTTGCGGAGAPLKRQPRNWERDGSRPSQRRIGKHDRKHRRFCVPLPHPTLTCLPALPILTPRPQLTLKGRLSQDESGHL